MSRLDELIAEYCPDGVEYKTLGELGKFFGGLTGKGKDDFKDGNAAFITYRNVYANSALDIHPIDKVKIIPGENQRTLMYGDVIFTGSSETPDECGFSSVVTKEPEEPLYLNSFCFFFRFDNLSVVDPDFAKHLFRSNNLRYQIGKTASGVTRYNVSKDKMAKVRIPLPPLPVQREIVRILDNFTELTEALTAELSKEVTCLGEQQKYYLNKLVSSANDYETKLLRELVSVKMCKRIKKDQTVSEGGVPFYKNGTLGRKADSYIPLELYEEYLQRYPFPQKGDVMLSTAGTVGRAYIYDGKPAYFQDSNVVWLENDETVISNEYLYWFCTSMPWKLPTRGTIKHLHNDMILDTPITIPPREAQEEFVGFLKNSINKFSEIHDCLLSEIDARQKQYVYYRDKLLTFEPLNK